MIDKFNIFMWTIIVTFGALFVWAGLAAGQIQQPLRSQLEIGCQYLNPQLDQMARWLYCGCVIQKLDLLELHWDQLPEGVKQEILISAVYLPCTANRREKA